MHHHMKSQLLEVFVQFKVKSQRNCCEWLLLEFQLNAIITVFRSLCVREHVQLSHFDTVESIKFRSSSSNKLIRPYQIQSVCTLYHTHTQHSTVNEFFFKSLFVRIASSTFWGNFFFFKKKYYTQCLKPNTFSQWTNNSWWFLVHAFTNNKNNNNIQEIGLFHIEIRSLSLSLCVSVSLVFRERHCNYDKIYTSNKQRDNKLYTSINKHYALKTDSK